MNKFRQIVQRIIKEERKRLNEFRKTKSKKKSLLEYLAREGDSIDELGKLNLFTDFAEGQLLSQYEDEYSESKQWMAIEGKYTKIANLLWKIVEKNQKVKLTEDDIELAERSWYDGSDAYQDPEMSCKYLPEIYDDQIEAIKQIFKNHRLK